VNIRQPIWLLDAAGIVIMNDQNTAGVPRSKLNFASAVRKKFTFLAAAGFREIESLPTIVRYRKSDPAIDIYHGRQSYEIGFGIAHDGIRYSISELIRATDSEAGKQFRAYAANTPAAIDEGLTQLEKLIRRYGERALRGDPEFFAALESQRNLWLQEHALDVLARQSRPEAAAAFQRGDYRKAAQLYEQIRPRLTLAELKKLAVAKERAGV
jgi:hypothetical protein